MSSWAHGLMGSRPHWLMGPWAHGPMGSWAHVLCVFLAKKPYESPDNHWFEVANELLIFAATVMTLMYTPFVTDVQPRSKLGNAFIVLFGYVCILNSVFILTSLCKAAQLLMRKYSVDQEQLEALRNGETALPGM